MSSREVRPLPPEREASRLSFKVGKEICQCDLQRSHLSPSYLIHINYNRSNIPSIYRAKNSDRYGWWWESTHVWGTGQWETGWVTCFFHDMSGRLHVASTPSASSHAILECLKQKLLVDGKIKGRHGNRDFFLLLLYYFWDMATTRGKNMRGNRGRDDDERTVARQERESQVEGSENENLQDPKNMWRRTRVKSAEAAGMSPPAVRLRSWEIIWPHNLGYPTSGRGNKRGGGQRG